jgi:hypothetical protein
MPKVSFWLDSIASPGNYGWIFVVPYETHNRSTNPVSSNFWTQNGASSYGLFIFRIYRRWYYKSDTPYYQGNKVVSAHVTMFRRSAQNSNTTANLRTFLTYQQPRKMNDMQWSTCDISAQPTFRRTKCTCYNSDREEERERERRFHTICMFSSGSLTQSRLINCNPLHKAGKLKTVPFRLWYLDGNLIKKYESRAHHWISYSYWQFTLTNPPN